MSADLSDYLKRLRQRGALADSQRSDRALVEHFLTTREPDPFQALVERHGPMVYRVCRRLLSVGADAEDAFQATFLVLLRQARTIRKRPSVASWLHGVAYRVALQARGRDAARRRHEQNAARLQPQHLGDETPWHELRTLLDAELERLAERFRAPLILCYLEGLTQDEAAGRLGWSLGTFRRRLTQAREVLARRLERRGVGPVTALAGPLLGECAALNVLSELIARTLHLALPLPGMSVAPVVPESINILMRGVVPTMFRQSIIAVLSVSVILIVLGFSLAASQHEPAAPETVPPANVGQQQAVVQGPIGPGNVKVPEPRQPVKQTLGEPLTPTNCWPSIAFSADGKTLAFVATGLKIQKRVAALHIHDVPTCKLIRSIEFKGEGGGASSAVTLSADGKLAALASGYTTGGPQKITITDHLALVCWDVASGKPAAELCQASGTGLPTYVFPTFSPDGKKLQVLSPTKWQTWDIAKKTVIAEKDLLTEKDVNKQATLYYMSDDAKLLAFSNGYLYEGGRVTVRDMTGTDKDRQLKVEGTPLAFSHGNRYLATCKEKSLTIWDLKADKEVARFASQPFWDLYQRCDISSDGKFVAWITRNINTDEKQLHLGDLTTGKECATLDAVDCPLFSPDGKTLACLRRDGTVELWDVAAVAAKKEIKIDSK